MNTLRVEEVLPLRSDAIPVCQENGSAVTDGGFTMGVQPYTPAPAQNGSTPDLVSREDIASVAYSALNAFPECKTLVREALWEAKACLNNTQIRNAILTKYPGYRVAERHFARCCTEIRAELYPDLQINSKGELVRVDPSVREERSEKATRASRSFRENHEPPQPVQQQPIDLLGTAMALVELERIGHQAGKKNLLAVLEAVCKIITNPGGTEAIQAYRDNCRADLGR